MLKPKIRLQKKENNISPIPLVNFQKKYRKESEKEIEDLVEKCKNIYLYRQ